MACGLALKRPHEYDNYLQLAGDAAPEAKRSRTSPLSCSPFRPQMGTLAASLPSGSGLTKSLDETGSIFSPATARCSMSRAQVDAFLKAEMRSLRRRKLIPKRCLIENNTEGGDKEEVVATGDVKTPTHPTSNYRVPGSPQSSSDSEGELSGSTAARRRVLATLPSEVATPVADLYKKPMYSLNQVVLMCERLLKEQEMRIRFEYQQILEKKLTEQQDQLSQLAAEAERIVTRPAEDYSCSYLS